MTAPSTRLRILSEAALFVARGFSELRVQFYALIHELLASAPQQRLGLQLASELKHVSPQRRADFEGCYRSIWMGGLGELIRRGGGVG